MSTERPDFDIIVAHAAPLIRKLVIRALAGCEHVNQIVEADSIERCLAECGRHECAVVLVDPSLAADPAAAVANLIRPGLTVLMLTARGWADDQSVQAALRAGARGVIVAPRSFMEADDSAPLIQRRVLAPGKAPTTAGAR